MSNIGAHHTAYAGAIGYLADALLQVGAVDSAESARQARRRDSHGDLRATGARSPRCRHLGLARIAAARGDTAAADSIYDAAREILLRQTTRDHPDVRFVDSLRAVLHVGRDEAPRASGLPLVRVVRDSGYRALRSRTRVSALRRGNPHYSSRACVRVPLPAPTSVAEDVMLQTPRSSPQWHAEIVERLARIPAGRP